MLDFFLTGTCRSIYRSSHGSHGSYGVSILEKNLRQRLSRLKKETSFNNSVIPVRCWLISTGPLKKVLFFLFFIHVQKTTRHETFLRLGDPEMNLQFHSRQATVNLARIQHPISPGGVRLTAPLNSLIDILLRSFWEVQNICKIMDFHLFFGRSKVATVQGLVWTCDLWRFNKRKKLRETKTINLTHQWMLNDFEGTSKLNNLTSPWYCFMESKVYH